MLAPHEFVAGHMGSGDPRDEAGDGLLQPGQGAHAVQEFRQQQKQSIEDLLDSTDQSLSHHLHEAKADVSGLEEESAAAEVPDVEVQTKQKSSEWTPPRVPERKPDSRSRPGSVGLVVEAASSNTLSAEMPKGAWREEQEVARF